MASNSDAVEGKYAYEKTVTGRVVAGAAGGIGCGGERSAFLTGGKTDDRREVVCGWENAVERLEQLMPPA